MKTVIFCGGLGTRLREETEFRPKPLVEIGGRPILWHIMKIYAHYGFHRFVLALGYRGQMVKEYFLNYEAMNNNFTICLGQNAEIRYHGAHQEQGFEVSLIDTGQESMTGGRLLRVAPHLPEDTFMVTYGDGVADINLQALVDFHHSHGCIGTVTAVHPVSRFGALEVDTDSRVRNFAEKPQTQGQSSAGFFVFNRRIFDYLEDDETILEAAPLERLAADGQLMAYQHEGFFFAMDTYREYRYLNDLWATGDAPWKVWS